MRQLSLRHVLVLAMTGLTALAVVLAVLLANREVRRSAWSAADERIARVTDQLARLVATQAEQRRALLLEVGRDPVLVRALRGEPVGDAELAGALAAVRSPADSGLPVQLWDMHGGPAFSDVPDARHPEARFSPIVPLESEPAYGAFREEAGEVRYYSTAPVRDGDAQLGWIVQERRIGNPITAAEIQRLIGSRSRVLVAYEGESVWVSLAGDPVQAPDPRPPEDSTVVRHGPGGERYLVHAHRVAGMPWSVLVEVPVSAVEAGSHAFVRRMAGAGLILVLLAMVLAYFLSRRLTRPLEALADASDAVAAGDHARRVPPLAGGGEVRRVATAFNAMAERVADSHRALEQRLAEARALADELEAANQEAEAARLAAESADRAKSGFLATMSHEIRTPINAVLGLAELLALEPVPSEKRADYLNRVQGAARQLAGLVDDILDLTKADSGGLRIESVTHPARDTIEQAVELMAERVQRKGLELEVSVEPDIVYQGDPRRVRQILVNLMANAVKFTPEGGRIRVVAERDGAPAGVVRIAVEDTGIGIDPSEADRIFEPFVQAQTGYTREYGGTGLGLSISRRLARLMDGDIEVSSQPGRGSRFTLTLPVAARAPHAG